MPIADPKRVVTDRQAANLRKQLARLTSHRANLDFETGRLLYEVRHTFVNKGAHCIPVWSSWGFSSFADFHDREMGLHRKKAETLINIWYTLEIEFDGKWDRRLLLPWTKMRAVIRAAHKHNINGWMRRAATMPQNELEDVIAQGIGLDRMQDEAPESYLFSARLTRDDLRAVEEALHEMRKVSTIARKGDLLAQVCKEWMDARPRKR